MSKARGMSMGRRSRRGLTDVFGRPLRKRPFNNSKRTVGRQLQQEVQDRYSEIMKRMRYIKYLAKQIKADKISLNKTDWKEKVRKYDSHQLIFDESERQILFELVNGAKRDI